MKITGWLDTGQQVQVLPMEPLLGSQERGDQVLASLWEPTASRAICYDFENAGVVWPARWDTDGSSVHSTFLGTLTGYSPRTRLPPPQGQLPHPVPKDTCKKDYSVTFGGRQYDVKHTEITSSKILGKFKTKHSWGDLLECPGIQLPQGKDIAGKGSWLKSESKGRGINTKDYLNQKETCTRARLRFWEEPEASKDVFEKTF